MLFPKKGNKGEKSTTKMVKSSNCKVFRIFCKAFRNLIQSNKNKCYLFTIINIKYFEIINLFVP